MALKLLSSRRLAIGLMAVGLVSATGGLVHADRASAVPDHPDTKTIEHVLNRIGFGARPGDIERVQQIGLAKYIEQQLYPDRIADDAVEARLTEFTTLKMSAKDVATKYYLPAQEMRKAQQVIEGRAAQAGAAADAPKPAPTPEMRMLQQNEQNVGNELMEQRLLRETMSERQLNEVMVDFWFNHFNVFIGKGQPERLYITDYERDVIRPNVLGNFRDLLGQVAHSPAMLFYLDNWESVDPHAIDRQEADALKNARSVMQQMQVRQRFEQQKKQGARGLNENYGRELMELHTLGVDGGYTQQDVIEVARAFTGWSINQPQQGGDFIFRPLTHDNGPKTVLGVTFPANQGEADGEHVLDLLARQPATAHHIAFQLAQRFVSDTPPPALVDRAAKVFLDSKGSIREVVRTIITSPEFFASEDAKTKTPLEFVVSAARAAGATVDNALPLVNQLRGPLGMPMYGCVPPTGYSSTADAWVNTGALLNRMNLALQMVSNQMRGVRVDVTSIAAGVDADARERLVQMMFGGHASDMTVQTLAKAQTPAQLLALALGSPEFQKR